MFLAGQLTELRVDVVHARDRDAVLQAAAQRLSCDALDTAALGDSLQARERLGSTAIGHGIAIPHGRMPRLQQPRGVLLRLQQPVEFAAADGQAVDLVFAMAVPDHYTHQHLMLLSGLAEKFSDPQFRHALRSASDATAMHAVLMDNTPLPEDSA